jgi:two-component sensor histidine kinase
MTLRQLCLEQTSLGDEDIAALEQVERVLPLIAELTGGDVFIDCYDRSLRTVMVAAQAGPHIGGSLYEHAVTGKTALRDKEPAVYRALESGLPARELKAITQEGKSVRQDVVPIPGPGGRPVGVLIREKDVSGTLRQEKKYRKLAKAQDEIAQRTLNLAGEGTDGSDAAREVHHRVKNDLQMVASFMNLQARRTADPQVKRALSESTQRVLSIASIHDIMTRSTDGGKVSLPQMLQHICRDIRSISGEGRDISIGVGGDDITVTPDEAASIAIVVNELVTNAVEHGYPGERSGHVEVTSRLGNLYHTVTVEDDGCGFDTEAVPRGSLGLQLVTLTVHDQLHGHFTLISDEKGTKASFDFRVK